MSKESNPSSQIYTSEFSIPYSSSHSSPLRTLDVHFPALSLAPTSAPAVYSLIFIHGGAFRDPLITSQSIIPSLPALFNLPYPPRAIASLNYRLSAYPSHPTSPSQPNDPSRNVRWPAHIEDVCEGVRWLTASHGDDDDADDEKWGFARGWLILVGHSVGSTMGLKMLFDSEKNGREIGTARDRIKAIVSLSGIADFVALRDAHLDFRDVYDGFCTAAFGDEGEGKWELGRVFPRLRGGVSVTEGEPEDEDENEDLHAVFSERDEESEEEVAGVEVIILGQGMADERVEWDQVEILSAGLRRKGWEEENLSGGTQSPTNRTTDRTTKRKGRKKMAVIELEGKHDEVWEQGGEIARCVGLAVEMVVGVGSAGRE